MTKQTIDATPTWRGILPMLMIVYREGETQLARDVAYGELRRMAEIADMYVTQENGKPRYDAS